jgi:hypothetical protein
LGELERDKLRILQVPWVFPPANGWPFREGKKLKREVHFGRADFKVVTPAVKQSDFLVNDTLMPR